MNTTLSLCREKATLARPPGLDQDLAVRKLPGRRLRCRQITAEDIETTINLLCEGFPTKPRSHWAAAFDIIGAGVTSGRMQRYGYMLESDGLAVGVLLVIVSSVHRDGITTIRSNGSAWYVKSDFRAYAHILVAKWLNSPSDSYLNVFPAEHTLRMLEAQGFVRFTNGISLSTPAIILPTGRVRILHAGQFAEAELPIPDEDHELLMDHFRAGCTALWCETRDGGYPFVFRRRLIKSRLPCAQLIYCRDLEDLARLAGPVGRYLLRLGQPVVLAATNGPIPGIPGVYFDGKYPMYVRGKTVPKPGDLAYTEAGLFGF
jgi:hypothetical protein